MSSNLFIRALEYPAFFWKAFDSLTIREKRILETHYGIGTDPLMLKDIATELGISISRVIQLKQRSFLKIRIFFIRYGFCRHDHQLLPPPAPFWLVSKKGNSMSYVPPGLPATAFEPGVHEVVLVGFVPIDKADTLAKLSAKVAYRATFKSLETAMEIDLLIKFNCSKADFYAGQNIDRLFLAAGLPEPTSGEPLDISAMVVALDGVTLLLEVNDKGYAQSVLVPEPAPNGTEEAF